MGIRDERDAPRPPRGKRKLPAGPRMPRKQIRLCARQVERVRQIAADQGISFSEAVRDAIDAYASGFTTDEHG